jgi:hypothetical protein
MKNNFLTIALVTSLSLNAFAAESTAMSDSTYEQKIAKYTTLVSAVSTLNSSVRLRNAENAIGFKLENFYGDEVTSNPELAQRFEQISDDLHGRSIDPHTSTAEYQKAEKVADRKRLQILRQAQAEGTLYNFPFGEAVHQTSKIRTVRAVSAAGMLLGVGAIYLTQSDSNLGENTNPAVEEISSDSAQAQQ